MQSESGKNSTGDYAEIGPELMRSVHFHSRSAPMSHYCEINDSMLQPSPYCTTNVDGINDSHGKENPYDDPDSSIKTVETSSSVAPDAPPSLNLSYSKLDRMVPFIYVSNETDSTDHENLTGSAPSHHYYHTLEQSTDTSSVDQTDNDFYSGKALLPQNPLPTILEHPYHVLDQSGPIFDADYQDTDMRPGPGLESAPPTMLGNESANYEYDRLVDPQLYSLLDHSTVNPELSKIYDIKSGPYSRLDVQNTSQYRRRSKSITELELSAEIFDDVQYIAASPLPTPKSADLSREIYLNSRAEERSPSECSEVASKYNGDYERDPNYIQGMKSGCVDPAKSSSLPNIYQPLQVTAMDPIQDYENYLPRPQK